MMIVSRTKDEILYEVVRQLQWYLRGNIQMIYLYGEQLQRDSIGSDPFRFTVICDKVEDTWDRRNMQVENAISIPGTKLRFNVLTNKEFMTQYLLYLAVKSEGRVLYVR